MKTVNDFLTYDHFLIKDTKNNNEVLGLQINIWGEHELSDKYGNREVISHRVESDLEIWGDTCFDSGEPSLVLYI